MKDKNLTETPAEQLKREYDNLPESQKAMFSAMVHMLETMIICMCEANAKNKN